MSKKETILSNFGSLKDSKFVKDDIGAIYENQSEAQDEHAGGFVTKTVAPLLKRGSHVLDVGCGTGKVSLKLLKLVGDSGSVFGIDIAEGMIKTAQEKAKEHVNLQFAVCDALLMDCSRLRSSYDLVYSSYALHWVKEQEAVFTSIFKKIADGGKFISTFTLSAHETETEAGKAFVDPTVHLINACADAVLPEERKEHLGMHLQTLNGLRAMLEKIGFRVDECSNLMEEVDLKGDDEAAVTQKVYEFFETWVTIATDTDDRLKILRRIAKRCIELGKSPEHEYSEIQVGGKKVNFFEYHEGENGKQSFCRIKILCVAVVAVKK